MRIIVISVISILFFSSCDSIQKFEESQKPLEYLSIENGTFTHNLVQKHFFSPDDYDGYILEGDIHNNAFKVGFNNIILRLNYSNAQGKFIKSENYNFGLHVAPNTSVHFRKKFYPPNTMKNIQWSIASADGG